MTEAVKAKTSPQYIIGIGASAGGMEVLHELFDSIPDNTDFAYVVIQHLSSDHKSLMSELLTKHTMMQVDVAEDGVEIVANRVYVIPSRKMMTIRDGKLILDDKIKGPGPNNAIDIFFSSLAKDQKKKAVGIILSGTGSDGSKGIQEIKSQGGFIIVQDPLTASFDGMPTNAIATGVADMVLPPEMIAEELIGYLKDQPLIGNILPGTFEAKDELVFREILSNLNSATRHDFTYYKRPTLLRRLAKRMSEVNIPNIREYKSYIEEHKGELKVLAREFLINVTRFFRDPSAFESLKVEVIPAIFQSKGPDEPIKIWSAGCSSGEEAYSLAMLFTDFASRNRFTNPIKIFATDIEQSSLEVAGRGIYKESIENDIPNEYLRKYFIREDGHYRIHPAIRKMVVFANHDVLRDPPFSKLDLVVCRNMLIYINPVLQKKVLRKFHFALNLNSFLFLGPSENIGMLKDTTKEVQRKWKIYKCINKALNEEKESLYSLSDSKKSVMGLAAEKKPVIDLNVMLRESLVEDRTIAAVTIDTEFNVKQAVGKFKNFMQFSDEAFHLNLLKLVPRDLSIAISVAVRKAVSSNITVCMKKVIVHEGESERHVNLIVRRITDFKDTPPFLFIVMEEVREQIPSRRIISETVTASDRIDELEKELSATRDNLQSVIEEVESTNEELQSSNEELISTNEELQSTNEELQSLNEELNTVSAEHQVKINELIELNDDLDNYFRSSETGQLFVDRNMIIKKFNHIATQAVNLIATDIGRSISDITTRIPELDLIRDIQSVMKSSGTIEKEFTVDNESYFLMKIHPYMKRDKSVDGAVINFIDITHSKKLFSIVEGVFNSTTNAITAKKAVRNNQNKIVDFEFITVNKTFSRMYNMEIPQLIGKSFKPLYGDFYKIHMEAYIHTVETGETSRFEYYHQKFLRWFETTVVKMLDGIVATHVDITDRKLAADIISNNYEELKKTTNQLQDSNTKLEQSNLDLMQFASVASHDLKEPLRKIQTFGNILQSKVKDKLIDGELNYLTKMISASGRMQTLIDDVLTLSKLSNSSLVHAPVNLKKIVKRITEDLEITISEKNAAVNIGPLPEVYAVSGQMHQLFQNLISNSIKFNDKENPVITVEECEFDQMSVGGKNIHSKDFHCIKISDNGIGFEEEYVDKIFGIFQRVHGRQYEGTGIGLAIAKKIVENHHGFITAESVPGSGATFSIFLPREKLNGNHPNEQREVLKQNR